MKSRQLIGILAALALGTSLVGGCGIAESASGGSPKWVWAEIKENVANAAPADPEDDFHLYVNRDWILENELPAGESSYSKYRVRQDDVDREMQALLQDTSLTSENAAKTQALYGKVLDWDSRGQIGFAPLEAELAQIEEIDDLEDLIAYMTDTSDSYPLTLVSFYASPDLRDSERNILFADQPELILYDAAEYTQRTEVGQRRYDRRRAVLTYILGKLGRSEQEAQEILDRAIEFEAQLAVASYAVDEMYMDDFTERILNIMTAEELCALCPGYPMQEVLKSLGMDGQTEIDVTNPAYISALGPLMTEENVRAIKDMMIVRIVFSSYILLDEQTYRDCAALINEIDGVTGTVSDEKMAYEAVKNIMPIECQQLYIEVYGSEEKRQLITDICTEVINTYADMLRGNAYLSEETVEKAVEKLYSIRINALYPDKWPDMTGYDPSSMSYYEAAREHERFITEYSLRKVGTRTDRDMWVDFGEDEITVLDCNAFYSPSDNSINMIMGMMGAPFYFDGMSTEGIYASLGAFWIGHEISHAFDSFGCQFDKDGNFISWWTDEDWNAFGERIDKVDAYLSSIEVSDGQFVIGSNVDTEMVADITGLQAALLMAEKVEDFDYSEFFTTYGSMNVNIATESFEQSLLLSDAHPLDYLRTNVPVQQFDEFYAAFDVKEGDGMYLAPEDRILVW